MTAPTTPEQEQEQADFYEWFEREFPVANGTRERYRTMMMMDLMFAAWAGGQARAARAAPASPWLPIESAPKDGTESLFYTKESGRVVLYWNDWPEWPAESEVVEERWSNGFSDQRFDPTHWMPMAPPPLPAAPLAGPVEQGEPT